jgi:hypothetical protein
VSSSRIAALPVAWSLGFVLTLMSFTAGAQSVNVQITGLRDLHAAASSRLALVLMRGQACIRTTDDQARYQVRIGSGTGTEFKLRNTAGTDELPFSVVWDSQAGQGRSFDRPGETALLIASGLSCGPDAYLTSYEVRVERHDLLSVAAGTYQGSLAIDISVP